MIKIVLLVFTFSFLGCAVFVKNNQPTYDKSIIKTKIIFEINKIVKDFEGKDYYKLDSIIESFANETLQGCSKNCAKEVHIKIQFYSESNSKDSIVFKLWEWAGILTFGLIPVIEKTQHKIIAEITSKEKKR